MPEGAKNRSMRDRWRKQEEDEVSKQKIKIDVKAGIRELLAERKTDQETVWNQVKNRLQCGKFKHNGGTAKSKRCRLFSVYLCERERRNEEVGGGGQPLEHGPGNCQESYRNKKLSPASLLCSDHAATTAL